MVSGIRDFIVDGSPIHRETIKESDLGKTQESKNQNFGTLVEQHEFRK